MDERLARLRRAAADDPEKYSQYVSMLLKAGRFQEVAFGHFAAWRANYNTPRGAAELNALVDMVKKFIVHNNPAAAAIQVGAVHPFVLVLVLQITHGENNVTFNVENPTEIQLWEDPWEVVLNIRQQRPWNTYEVQTLLIEEERETLIDPFTPLSDGELVEGVYDILWEHNLV